MSLFKFTNGTHFQDKGFDPIQQERIPLTVRFSLSILSFLGSSYVISSILLSRKAHVRGFNLYLIFLLLPEVYIGALMLFMIIPQFTSGFFPPSDSVCIVASITYNSYLFSHMWINVLTTLEIFQMLQISSHGKRFRPSPPRKACFRVSIIYVASLAIGIYQSANLPISNSFIYWDTCIATRQYEASLSINRILMPFLILFLPFGCLLYMAFFIYKRKMLRRAGKCRFIAIYFIRIIFTSAVAVVLISLAFIFLKRRVLILIASPVLLSQGLVVSILSLQKKDIWNATTHIFFSRKEDKESPELNDEINEDENTRKLSGSITRIE